MFAGIDIGGTKCAVTLGDRLGNIKEKIRFCTSDVNETLDKIFDIHYFFEKFHLNYLMKKIYPLMKDYILFDS